MLGDMGRGTLDDSKSWHQYGAPAVNVSLALTADVHAGLLDGVFVFGDLSYAMGCALCLVPVTRICSYVIVILRVVIHILRTSYAYV
eukprot:7751362-Pyramimonas_sp.AAC.3